MYAFPRRAWERAKFTHVQMFMGGIYQKDKLYFSIRKYIHLGYTSIIKTT